MKKLFPILLPFLFLPTFVGALSVSPSTVSEKQIFQISGITADPADDPFGATINIAQEGLPNPRNFFSPGGCVGVSSDFCDPINSVADTMENWGTCGYVHQVYDGAKDVNGSTIIIPFANSYDTSIFGSQSPSIFDQACDFSGSHNFRVYEIWYTNEISGVMPHLDYYDFTVNFTSSNNNFFGFMPANFNGGSAILQLASAAGAATSSVWFLIIFAAGIPLAFWIIFKFLDLLKFRKKDTLMERADRAVRKSRKLQKEAEELSSRI